MRTISLRLDAETDAILRALCDRSNTTQTEVVRRALVLLASRTAPSAAELAVEVALVGAFASRDPESAAPHSPRLKARLATQRQTNERSAGAGTSALPSAKAAVSRSRARSDPSR